MAAANVVQVLYYDSEHGKFYIMILSMALTFFVVSNSEASDEYSSPPSRLDADATCRTLDVLDVCSESTNFECRLLQSKYNAWVLASQCTVSDVPFLPQESISSWSRDEVQWVMSFVCIRKGIWPHKNLVPIAPHNKGAYCKLTWKNAIKLAYVFAMEIRYK